MNTNKEELFIPRPLPPELCSEVRAFVVEIEATEHVKCLVVHNPYALGVGAEYNLQLILLPQRNGCVAENFEVKAKDLSGRIRDKRLLSDGKWGLSVSYLDWSYLDGWFGRFKDEPLRMPMQNFASGCLFISPVIYGDVCAEDLRSRARSYFGANILSEWVEAMVRHVKKREEKERAYVERQNCLLRERKRVLNRIEIGELRAFVSAVGHHVKNSGIECIVALDGSGRPIGKVLEVYLENRLPVFYVDPHPLKKLLKLSSHGVGRAIDVLQSELPELYTRLVRNADRVLFIDDQTGYGHTAESLRELVEAISGKEGLFQYAAMTQYQGNNTPSWLRNRPLQGIQLVEHALTFMSLEVSTPQSRRFYARLRRLAQDWRR